MIFEATPIDGVHLVRSTPHTDARGRFTRLYCAEAFDAVRPGCAACRSTIR